LELTLEAGGADASCARAMPVITNMESTPMRTSNPDFMLIRFTVD
jgi:hypothetical protein